MLRLERDLRRRKVERLLIEADYARGSIRKIASLLGVPGAGPYTAAGEVKKWAGSRARVDVTGVASRNGNYSTLSLHHYW